MKSCKQKVPLPIVPRMFPTNSQLDDVENDADDGSQQIHSHSSALHTQEEAVVDQRRNEESPQSAVEVACTPVAHTNTSQNLSVLSPPPPSATRNRPEASTSSATVSDDRNSSSKFKTFFLLLSKWLVSQFIIGTSSVNFVLRK